MPIYIILMTDDKSANDALYTLTYNVLGIAMLCHAVVSAFDLLTLNDCMCFGYPVVKLRSKFKRNRTICGEVIAIQICPIWAMSPSWIRPEVNVLGYNSAASTWEWDP